ncbi:MAG: hypothetical protein FJ285_09145 [Planctomycetes bacterium]|nr:hypothetical protein [Planctomycetota bacterium]
MSISTRVRMRIEWGLATSFCVLATILVMLCLQPSMESKALAGDSVQPPLGGISVMTLTTGQGPDARPTECAYVLDTRGARLFVYAVETNGGTRTLQLRTVESIPALFRSARPR